MQIKKPKQVIKKYHHYLLKDFTICFFFKNRFHFFIYLNCELFKISLFFKFTLHLNFSSNLFIKIFISQIKLIIAIFLMLKCRTLLSFLYIYYKFIKSYRAVICFLSFSNFF